MAQNSGMIPTIILTGFLGAGKTTLLNRLIKYYDSKRTVLLINEFGKVGIDGELLVEGNYHKIELNKGSLFCICVRTDFIDEVEKIALQIHPDLLIIEATGLADTSEMEKMLALPNLKDFIDLQSCICLVDAQNFLKIKDNLKAPGSQVKSADFVLINKSDLVSEQQVAAVTRAVREFSPKVPIVKTEYADFPLSELEKIRHPEIPVAGSLGEGRPDPIVSVTLIGEGSFTRGGWEQFKAFVEHQIMRMKGFILIENESYFAEATMDQWALKQADRDENDKMNRLVLIGRKLDEDAIGNLFQKLIKAE